MSWIKGLIQEVKLKTSLILDGNVRDEFYKDQTYLLLPDFLKSIFTQPDWLMTIIWDPSKNLIFSSHEEARRYNDILYMDEDRQTEGDDFDMGDDDVGAADLISTIKILEFSQLLDEFSLVSSKSQDPLCLIINWGDYQFNPSNMLQDNDRANLVKLGKYSIESNQSERIKSNYLNKPKSTIILITSNVSHIPYSFYQPDPRVRVITIPKPDLTERREFVLRHFDDFKITDTQNERTRDEIADDLSALTDDFTTADLRMLLELSNQMERKYDSSKLVSLYKFGEKDSPWELLTDQKLQQLKQELNSRVIGQENAVDHVVNTIIKASLGISGLQHSAKRTKPKGSLFFTGPTGVGKTELAKGIAKFLFGDESAFIRFDMSEFKQEEADQRLIGAPPGYVGFENGGQLTNAVMEKPFSVILFDEIEKAHPRILDIFLGILEDGRLTDGRGETAYFSETLIIFTSNLGATEEALGTIGNREDHYKSTIENHFINTLGRPEILNRIGENLVIFNKITEPNIMESILSKKLEPLQNFVEEKFASRLNIDQKVLRWIVNSADPKYGGRGIINIAEKLFINPLSEFIFKNKKRLNENRFIQCKLSTDNVEFEIDDL